MDPLSLAASITALIGFGLGCAKTIHNLVRSVAHAPSSARQLAEELELLGTVLDELVRFLRSEKAAGRVFHQHDLLVASKASCEARVAKLQEKLGRVKKSSLTGVLKWPLNEDEVSQEMAAIHQYVLVFQFSVTIDGFEILCKQGGEVERTLKTQVSALQSIQSLAQGVSTAIKEEALRTSEQYKEILQVLASQKAQQENVMTGVTRTVDDILAKLNAMSVQETKFLDWLSPLDHTARLKEIKEKRTKGTGEGLVESEPFQTWFSSSTGNSTNLWCPGIPGSGKTVATTTIIDYVASHYQGTDLRLACFYFDYKSQSIQTPANFVGSLLKQVISQMGLIPPYASKLHRDFQQQKQLNVPGRADMLKVLIESIADLSDTFIVIDALDESEGGRHREPILRMLNDLAASSAHVLVTSRPHAKDIKDHLGSWPQMKIAARRDDIDKFLRDELAKNSNTTEIMDDELIDKVISELTMKSAGMFLLPYLQIGHLLKQTSALEVKEELQRLSTVLDDQFQLSLDRIQEQSDKYRDLAMLILKWLSYTRRLLTIDELRHAVAIKLGRSSVPKDAIRSANMIIQCCLGLITTGGGSSTDAGEDEDASGGDQATVRLVHLSLQEYLEDNRSKLFGDGESEILKDCLTYLTLDDFVEPAPTDESLTLRARQYPFLRYAAPYWGYHGGANPDDEAKGLIRRLCSANYLPSYTQALLESDETEVDLGRREEAISHPVFSSLHVAAMFGLNWLVEEVLDDTEDKRAVVNSTTVSGQTPLMLAAMAGWVETIKALLNTGHADVNASTSNDKSALSLATYRHDVKVVHALLEYPETDPNGEVALLAGAIGRQEVDAGLLAEFLACPRYDPNLMCSLSSAIFTSIRKSDNDRGAEIFQLLLNAPQLNPNLTSKLVTLLTTAVRKGRADIVKLFIADEKTDVNAQERAETPLIYAVRMGRSRCVEGLVKREDTDVHKAETVDTALTIAIDLGHLEIARLLLECPRTDPNLARTSGLTPLAVAAMETGDKDMVSLLINRSDIKPSLARLQVDAEAGTIEHEVRRTAPLALAIVKNRMEIVPLLLARGDIQVNIRDWNKQTPLHLAVQYGRDKAVRMLLDREDVDVNALDKGGLPAALFAVVKPVAELVDEEDRLANYEKSGMILKMLFADERFDIALFAGRYSALLESQTGEGEGEEAEKQGEGGGRGAESESKEELEGKLEGGDSEQEPEMTESLQQQGEMSKPQQDEI